MLLCIFCVVGPVIQESGGNAYFAMSGNSQTFLCTATGSPLPDIQWIKEGQLVLPSLASRIQLQQRQLEDQNMVESSLTITDLTPSDRGNYVCFASNGIGTNGILSSPFRLTITPGNVKIVLLHNVKSALLLTIVNLCECLFCSCRELLWR